ncbi:hypothetical protein [Chryseobacterium sp. 2987]|uniref:hypothetical protein n=1 Tax=Chryseobacterium sp. 2987 TaxID=2817767 RepID=UPI00286257B3|nr:hypothetical protein [Chryseobacterium sp. 2987]MDR6919526.1 hypothetical protein [Chryseobacterium sp. 2987]
MLLTAELPLFICGSKKEMMMLIKEEDYNQVLHYLIGAYEKGEKYVVYEDFGDPVGNEAFQTFRTAYDAMEECFERTTDHDSYGYLFIPSVCQAMQEGIRDSTLLIKYGAICDISTMTIDWMERMKEIPVKLDEIAEIKYINGTSVKEKNGKTAPTIECKDAVAPKKNREEKQSTGVRNSKKTEKRKGRLGL